MAFFNTFLQTTHLYFSMRISDSSKMSKSYLPDAKLARCNLSTSIMNYDIKQNTFQCILNWIVITYKERRLFLTCHLWDLSEKPFSRNNNRNWFVISENVQTYLPSLESLRQYKGINNGYFFLTLRKRVKNNAVLPIWYVRLHAHTPAHALLVWCV